MGLWKWYKSRTERSAANWYLRHYDEAKLFSSVKELEAIASKLKWRVTPLGSILIFAIIIFTVAAILGKWLEPYTPLPMSIRKYFWSMLPGACVGLSVSYGAKKRISNLLRKELLSRNVPVCIKCGYFLRGIDSEKCPECGREIEAGIRQMVEEDAKRQSAADNMTSE